MRRSTTRPGFTLIEMAVVLIIVGIIATLTIPLVGEKLKQDKLAKSRGGLNSLKQEIIGYVQTNKALPAENTVETSFANARDAQQNYIAYYVDPDLKSGDICTQTTTDYALTIGGTTYSNLAFIIAGRGANQNLQIGAASGGVGGTLTVTSHTQGTATDTINANPPNTTQTYDLSGAGQPDTTLQFDDLVEYVSLDALKTKIGCTSEDQEPTNSALGFNSIAQEFTPGNANSYRSTANIAKVNPVSEELLLGNGNTGTACLYYNGTYNDPSQARNEGTSATIRCTAIGSGTTARSYCTASHAGQYWDQLAAVFRFGAYNADTSAASTSFRGGLVFTLLSADTNGNGLVTTADGNMGTGGSLPCGGTTASYLGYAGTNGGRQIRPPKLGVEIDFYPEAGAAGTNRQDPGAATAGSWTAQCSGETTVAHANHVAVVFFTSTANAAATNDNYHGATCAGYGGFSFSNPAYASEYTAAAAACTSNNQNILSATQINGFSTNATAYATTGKQWMEDGAGYWLRVQVDRAPRTAAVYQYNVHYWISQDPDARFLELNLDPIKKPAQMTKDRTHANYYENATFYLPTPRAPSSIPTDWAGRSPQMAPPAPRRVRLPSATLGLTARLAPRSPAMASTRIE